MSTRTVEYAQSLDEKYPAEFRKEFYMPTLGSLAAKSATSEEDRARESLYFCGNSLGLMPRAAEKEVQDELNAWRDRGVISHFNHPRHKGWVAIDEEIPALLAPVVGAQKPSEVAIMNTLTGNLHSMMAAFYRPTKGRYKVLFEAKAFPSDTYALQNQVRLHGHSIEDGLIALSPREGEYILRTEDILKAIEEEGDKIAVVVFSGIQYYTGQLFDIPTITKAAKAKGCVVGWDLAHAVGNVPLELHAWDVDFAVFCTYKYLNSGPGAIGGLFVHSKHDNEDIPRLAGWWGNNPVTRFQMANEFDPIVGAGGYKMSNPSVLNVVCVQESLKIFEKAGYMKPLRERSASMTNYLYELLTSSKYYLPVEQANGYYNIKEPKFTIITPADSSARGAQLSVLYLPSGKGVMQHVFEYAEDRGVIADERQPDVVRYAPNHFYNTHEECLRVAELVEAGMADFASKH
ncbi:kynureninase [Trichomonascus vanleenenianus]|uniref:kynureninase n=1 Tax=Trichomonascus vanleenenianus TaxID=2268995 RepID=UPI003EC9F851